MHLIKKLAQVILAQVQIKSLEDAIKYVKDHQSNYSGEWYNINNTTLEENIKSEYRRIWEKPIYRAVVLENKEDLDLQNLGVYWTYTRGRAKAHWGYGGGFLAIIEAQVREEDIDWLGTLHQRLQPKYADEDEVRLLETARPKINKIEWMTRK